VPSANTAGMPFFVSEYKDINFRESNTKGIWRFNWLPLHEPLRLRQAL